MRNIHELNAALFDSQYEIVRERGEDKYWAIYDRSLPFGFQILAVLIDMEDVFWFIIDNCTISRKK